jgi:hypothetical protein
MTWQSAADEWALFLDDVSDKRHALRCSWGNAWFRGHENAAEYELRPRLLRKTHPRDAPRIAKIKSDLSDLASKREFRELIDKMAETRKAIDRANTKKLHAEAEVGRRTYASQHRRLDQGIATKRDALMQRLNRIKLLPTGEREAFIEYCARSGRQESNSWEVLAEMQHHGIPTRLLDWTETLSAALFFALRVYIIRIEELWRQYKREKHDSPRSRLPDDILNEIKTLNTPTTRKFPPLTPPSVWILNPFRVSERVTKRARIWDLTRHLDYDYYEQFIVRKTWPFDEPIPTYSPWRIPRLAAQQGTFLVWGKDRRPANQIFGEDFVREVHIKPRAAVYGVYLLSHVLSVDHFSMFRDLDSLASSIRDKYIEV